MGQSVFNDTLLVVPRCYV